MDKAIISESSHFCLVISIIISMLISIVPPELGASFDERYSTSNETITIDFDETFTYESTHSAWDEPEEVMSFDSIPGSDFIYCNAIRAFTTPDWDCSDLANYGSGDFWNGHYLEYEKYTVDIQMIYKYEIRHFGEITYEISTTWSSESVPISTITLESSTEDYVISAKVLLRIDIQRIYHGPSNDQNELRNQFLVDIPFISNTDIDGSGNTIQIGFDHYYIWDEYKTFYDAAGEWSNSFGETIGLDGSINVASFDLLELACSWLGSNISLSATALLCNAFNYVISINFNINLDLEVDIRTFTQIYLETNSITEIQNSYNTVPARIGYGNLLIQSSEITQQVPGNSQDISGILGFYYQIDTDESYSTHLTIEANDNYYSGTLWNMAFGNSDGYSIPINTGLLPSSSSGYKSIITDNSLFVDGPSENIYTNNNNPPMPIIEFDSTSESIIYIEEGESIVLSTQGTTDSDGDTLIWNIEWNDGSELTVGSSEPYYVATNTYENSGYYTVYASVTDGIDISYPEPLTVIVNESNRQIDYTIISDVNNFAYSGEDILLDFNVISSELDLTYCLWDGDSEYFETCQNTNNGVMNYQFYTYYSEGKYSPRIGVFDTSGSEYEFLDFLYGEDIEVITDTRFDESLLSDFQIIDNQILIVIDDEDRELTSLRTPDESQNSNNSFTALNRALSEVSRITDIDYDMFYVGDTDMDFIVDETNSTGPGLNFLKDYSTIIWTTGNSFYPLTEEDRTTIRVYLDAGGSIIMFSQDMLYGECMDCNIWDNNTFINDIFGVVYSEQDIGEPFEQLHGFSGGGYINTEYLPLSGMEEIEISPLQSNNFQDHISSTMPSREVSYDFDLTWENPYSVLSGDWYVDNSYGNIYSSNQNEPNTSSEVYINLTSDSNYTSISFDFKVSSELGYDGLAFYIDDIEQNFWSGEVDWQKVYYNLSQGEHELKWSYQKDSIIDSGIDMAWIDNITFCCTDVVDQSYAIDILSDNNHKNFAVVKMHDGGGRAALYTVDPVQIDRKHDLENLFLQSIYWSENEWWNGDINYSSFIAVGTDGTHRAIDSTGGISWFRTNLFSGQNIRINTSIDYGFHDYEVKSIRIINNLGDIVLGYNDPSTGGMAIDFQSTYSGLYYIAVEIIISELGSEWINEPPWFSIKIQHLEDNNKVGDTSRIIEVWDVESGYMPSMEDTVSPLSLGTQYPGSYGDYSSSSFCNGAENILEVGQHYLLSLTSFDKAELVVSWEQFGYPNIDNNIILNLNQYENFETFLSPGNNFDCIEIYNQDEYGNAYLDTVSYMINIVQFDYCGLGSYRDINTLECVYASEGHYVPDINIPATFETACPVGTYQPSIGQNQCLDVDPGYYSSTIGATTQIMCPAGTYQPNPGQQSCIDSEPGYYVDKIGQVDQTPAPLDKYSEGFRSITAISCPPDKITNTIASVSINDCYQDTDGDRISDNFDLDDDGDGVIDSKDMYPLDPNEWADNDLDGIGDNSDLDDDNDGFSDLDEIECETSILISESFPSDFDGDGICDGLDLDNTDGPLSITDEESSIPGFTTITTILIIITTGLIVKFRRLKE